MKTREEIIEEGVDRGSTSSPDNRIATRTWARSRDEHEEGKRHRIKQHVESLYRKYFLELILRQRPLSASNGGRRIPLEPARQRPLIDPRRGHAYIRNAIRSSRYTVYDFLPKQLLFQATRLGNFYFICIGIPQAIPGFSTTGNYTTILPLLFFILLTVAKEGYDDYRRHRLDKVENRNSATVLRKGNDHGGRKSTPGSGIGLPSFSLHQKKNPGSAVEYEMKSDSLRWTEIQWRDIKVGDVVKLQRDDPVPADIVLLHADGENGVAYIETMALDGETNFKVKQAPPALKGCSTVEGIRSCRAEFVVEDPNRNLYDFNGRVTVDEKTSPITLNEVIFRGSVLRNTGCAIGMVINTGEECKIRMNANHHPKAKRPRLEKYVNQIVLTLVAYVITLSVGCSVGYIIWQRSTERHAFYLHNAAVPFKEIIIGFLIEFNNVIPLALYVSLEIVKLGQAIMVNGDVEMYDEASDTPMRCNTNTIIENLGQVNYILSDKTGTLTENVMKFRKLSIAGTAWLHDMDIRREQCLEASERKSVSNNRTSLELHRIVRVMQEEHDAVFSETSQAHLGRPSTSTWRSTGRPDHIQPELTTADLVRYIRHRPLAPFSVKAREFILAIALCHTCLSEERDGVVDFQASSPDELALVQAAQDLGFVVTHRSSQSIILSVADGNGDTHHETYEILDVIEFSSKRKRMSVIVRCPDGRIWLICKGADSVLLPRLKEEPRATKKVTQLRKSREVERELDLAKRGALSSLNDPSLFDNAAVLGRCIKHLDDFASEGLRTLLFAHKFISPGDYDAWKQQYQEATTALQNRQERVEAAGDLIEQSFELLGATAIEDRLQKGVPETIDKLRRANIRIWMLTGDKRETAIKIAQSARLCQPESTIHVLDAAKGDLERQMRVVADEIQHDSINSVAVIDGHTLAVVENDPALNSLFFNLIASIESVICCRATPAQKATIVKAINTRVAGALTLAIGDGANDIAMIQAAHVGIGISGKEGLQAARVADYSIAQFRFLQRLLLVHGRWNYVRTAKFVLMTFWKEFFFYMMQALYQRYNGYTGTSLYESWSLTVLNTLFTSLCVIIMGIFEQDLSADTLLAMPELYVFGQNNMGLNLRKYLSWVFCATAEGMIVWFVCWAAYGRFGIPRDEGLFALGDLVFSLGIIWTNWKLFIIETHHKSIIVIVSFTVTFAGWWAWNLFLAAAYQPNLSPYAVRGSFTHTFGRDPIWWLTLLLVFMVLVTLEYGYKSIKRNAFAGNVGLLRVNVPWPTMLRRRRRRLRKEVAGIGMERPRKERVEWDRELWQEMELVPSIRARLKELAAEGMGEVDVGDADRGEVEDAGGDVESATISSSA